MMKAFLEYVAEDIIKRFGTNLTDIAVVFPNKRASLFLNQYLYRAAGNKPVWCPTYITISELFRSQSELTIVDPIEANCILYDVYAKHIANDYQQLGKTVESMDKFWSWGQMMMADFDDLDKNMGDADLIYNNVRDLTVLDVQPESYLTDSQKQALKEFFHLVEDDNGSMLKKNFEALWNNLANIYHDFNNALLEKGLAYEGALYRKIAERADTLEWQKKTYLFVGFNMIQKSEQTLFTSIKAQGKALFYWDYDVYYKNQAQTGNEAGLFINNELLLKFPNALEEKDEIYDNFSKEKDVTYYSSATESLQARYISDWLSENGRLNPGQRTAIVLSDESLLKSVIHDLPKETSGKANITVGYPLSQSPVTSLVKNFILLHKEGYDVQNGWFKLKQVSTFLRHPYARFLSEKAPELLQWLLDERMFFPTVEQLNHFEDESLEHAFHPYDGNIGDMNKELISRLLVILQTIGKACEEERIARVIAEGGNVDESNPTYEEQFMEESIFRMYNILSRVCDLITENALQVDTNTMMRILDQIVQTSTMPFHGEPAVDLQIMGVLETRNLDFDHILLLSCNEGNLPKSVNDASLIPYIIRKSHGLTTVDNKVAIYAYYFYRLLQRCSDIGIAYNSSTEDGHTGQMSRFMLQLMVEAGNINFHQKNLIARQIPEETISKEVEKDENIMNILSKIRSISPSLLGQYLRCPLQFYYCKIVNLNELEEDDAIDSKSFGTIFHAAVEEIYKNMMDKDGTVTKKAIKLLLDDKENTTIQRYVDKAFCTEFFNGRNPHYDGMQIINRAVIIRFINQLLKTDYELAPFRIIGLEQDAYEQIEFTQADSKKRQIQIGGSIDRLDCVTVEENGETKNVLRVIDYKTGGKEPEIMPVADLFKPENIDRHSQYPLQAMLYAVIVRHFPTQREAYVHGEKSIIKALNPGNLAVRPALLYIQKSGSMKDPVLKVGDKKSNSPVADIIDYEPEYRQELSRLLAEIFDPSVPFKPVEGSSHCQYCPYAKLCKR